jgi:N-acetylmuramoyl-L-alanine amidase
MIRRGERSEQVADVQARLRALGFEVADEPGSFGASTERAVRAFQERRQILADGVVGPQTWNELVEAGWRLGDRILYLRQPPLRGDDVATLQARLNALGFDAGREDGIFGLDTDRAVRAFQKEYGVAEDGIFGPCALRALEGLRVDRPGLAAALREELRFARNTIAELFVMLDPGHGGNDTGDVGPNGLREADVCWDVMRRAAQSLATLGARVRFTRTEAESPTPSERAQRANELGADVFVSLHTTSQDDGGAERACAYYFRTSRAGRRLAEAVLAELSLLGSKDLRIAARSYPQLKETRMPAVLIEPACIKEPDDEKRLDDPGQRAALAAAIVEGLRRYCLGSPGS